MELVADAAILASAVRQALALLIGECPEGRRAPSERVLSEIATIVFTCLETLKWVCYLKNSMSQVLIDENIPKADRRYIYAVILGFIRLGYLRLDLHLVSALEYREMLNNAQRFADTFCACFTWIREVYDRNRGIRYNVRLMAETFDVPTDVIVRQLLRLKHHRSIK